jgi:DNA-directed RNA polymerase I and III subunit RPAC1
MNVKQKKKLPNQIEEKRKKVQINYDSPSNTSTYESSSSFIHLGYDNSFNFEDFQENFKINIIYLTDEEVVFDIIGIDAAIANAFRRILNAYIKYIVLKKGYRFQLWLLSIFI